MAKAKKKAVAKKGGGGRKAKAPTKAETVEVSNMSLLLGNMPPVKDILYHLDTIKGLQDRARTASAKVTEAKKKAREAGVDINALADTMGFERMDPLEMATYFRQLQVTMREKGMPVQLTLHEPKFGSPEEQSQKEGYDAGRAGRSPAMDRWPEGTPGSKEYMRGWNSGQRELAEKGVAKPIEADD